MFSFPVGVAKLLKRPRANARTLFLFWVRRLEPHLLRSVKLLLRLLPVARRNKPVRRSLWAGTPIISMAVNARAERLLGLHADSLVYQAYFITSDFTYNFSRWTRIPAMRIIVQYLVLIWACLRYQRFHFYCDMGLLMPYRRWLPNIRELDLLKGLGKQIFFWPYGGDVRTREKTESLGRLNCCMECPIPGEGCVCSDVQGADNIDQIKEYATAIFGMGDTIEYLPGSRNDLFFLPVDLNADGGRKYQPHYPSLSSERPLHIVHASNHRHYKGTRFLVDAVERLRREGLAVELTLVERVPNEEALKIYRTADIIFDQCLIGSHGYFAIEAMAIGKPVMVFIRKPELYLLRPEECPLINSPPDRIEVILRGLVNDRSCLNEIGVRGRQYVEKYYSLEAFAARLEKAYKDLGVM